MRCDNCQIEIEKGERVYRRVPEDFFFCSSQCIKGFENELWKAAQARKQAERKAESKAPEASGNQGKMVEGISVSR